MDTKLLSRPCHPQAIRIPDNLKMLNDMQQLLGTVNWIRPLLRIMNQDMALLFDLLKGDTALNSPRELTKEAQDTLHKVSTAIQLCQTHRFNPDLPFLFAVLGESLQLYGLIFQ